MRIYIWWGNLHVLRQRVSHCPCIVDRPTLHFRTLFGKRNAFVMPQSVHICRITGMPNNPVVPVSISICYHPKVDTPFPPTLYPWQNVAQPIRFLHGPQCGCLTVNTCTSHKNGHHTDRIAHHCMYMSDLLKNTVPFWVQIQIVMCILSEWQSVLLNVLLHFAPFIMNTFFMKTSFR